MTISLCETESKSADPMIDFPDDWEDGDIIVPTTLGGSDVSSFWLERPHFIVDAAHTCYPGMFSWIRPGEWRGFCVLSFFPTKPFGAFGGGALIGPTESIERMRADAWPLCKNTVSSFDYPAGIQSVGIMRRIQEVSEDLQCIRGLKTACDLDDVLMPCGFRRRWNNPVSLHVLSYTHDDPQRVNILRHTLGRMGYETGEHYPPLDGYRQNENWISVPFIYPELPEELKEHAPYLQRTT